MNLHIFKKSDKQQGPTKREKIYRKAEKFFESEGNRNMVKSVAKFAISSVFTAGAGHILNATVKTALPTVSKVSLFCIKSTIAFASSKIGDKLADLFVDDIVELFEDVDLPAADDIWPPKEEPKPEPKPTEKPKTKPSAHRVNLKDQDILDDPDLNAEFLRQCAVNGVKIVPKETK